MKSLVPFGPTTFLPTEFDRLFEGFLGRQNGTAADLRLRLDLHEDDEKYTVTAEVPGVQQEDLDITVVGDVLTIAGEKKKEVETEGYSERIFGRFERKIQFPGSVDPKGVVAETKDGVLTITLPKADAEKPHRIQVKS